MDRTLAQASRASSGRSTRVVTALSLTALLCAVVLAAPAGGARKAKSDLVITSAAWKGKSYFIWNESQAGGSFVAGTSNRGSGKAGRSMTAASFTRDGCGSDGGGSALAGIAKVPPLKAGKGSIRSFPAKASLKFGELGSYYLAARADFYDHVDESHEGNNCNDPPNEHVDVIPRRFAGTVDGEFDWPTGTVKDEWTGTVTFVFDAADEPGKYVYSLEGGSIKYTTSGTGDNGCTYSGGTTVQLNSHTGLGGLTIDYGFNDYELIGTISSNQYSITAVCPGQPPTTLSGPSAPAWLWVQSNPDKATIVRGLPVGARTGAYKAIDGSANCPYPGCDTSWAWHLAAK